MFYNVSQLLMAPMGSTRSFDLNEELLPETDSRGSGQARGTLELTRTHHGLLLMATIDVQVYTACGRCLLEFERSSRLTLEEECFPTIDPGSGRHLDPPDLSEGVIHIDHAQILDLSDVLRQYLLTDEPLRALCREDCQGICPDCGTDRNESACSCQGLPVDPRWGVLADLLRDGAV